MKSTLTHDAGLGVGDHHLRGDGLPLRGLKGHPNGVEAALQLAHLTGGIEVALASLIHRPDELTKLTPIIRRRQRQ
jgi:hypothetical protein